MRLPALRLAHWALFVGGALLLTLLATSVVGTLGFNRVKVGGPAYDTIMQGKDLVADILPPPLYVLEPYLVALQAMDDPAQAAKASERFGKLHADYADRHLYWQKQELPTDLAAALREADAAARQFWQVGLDQFFPALQRKDMDASRASLKVMSEAYTRHRTAIDGLVDKGNAYAEAKERQAADVISGTTFVVGAAGGFTVLLVLFALLGLNVGVVRPIGGLAHALVAIASRR